jgi:hypothetical protein
MTFKELMARGGIGYWDNGFTWVKSKLSDNLDMATIVYGYVDFNDYDPIGYDGSVFWVAKGSGVDKMRRLMRKNPHQKD